LICHIAFRELDSYRLQISSRCSLCWESPWDGETSSETTPICKMISWKS
jgi:hypothetical protein